MLAGGPTRQGAIVICHGFTFCFAACRFRIFQALSHFIQSPSGLLVVFCTVTHSLFGRQWHPDRCHCLVAKQVELDFRRLVASGDGDNLFK